MLGSCLTLRCDLIRFILRKSNWGDEEIGGVCQYLCKSLAWSEMQHLILINDVLVKPQSPVLTTEFHQRLMSLLRLVKLFCLSLVGLDLKKGEEANNGSSSSVSNFQVIVTAGADPITVKYLVKLHKS